MTLKIFRLDIAYIKSKRIFKLFNDYFMIKIVYKINKVNFFVSYEQILHFVNKIKCCLPWLYWLYCIWEKYEDWLSYQFLVKFNDELSESVMITTIV